MCRLLGWATTTATTLADLLGADDLAGFVELSAKHGDGWGVAHAEQDTLLVDKESAAARTSDRFAHRAHAHASDLALVHLRWATLGLPVVHDNVHPFTNGRLAFAHNGSIAPPSALEPLLDDQTRLQLRGDTDSERFFLAVLSRLLAGDTPDPDDDAVGRAYVETVRLIGQTVACSSLNSMLLTPSRLFAICSYDPRAEIGEDEPDYYRLRYRVTPASVVVASSGFGTGWTDLHNGQLLSVDRRTLVLTVQSLDLVPASL